MVLFDDFEAVRFNEENIILVTKGRYIYYIYDVKSNHWRKHKNAGYDRITVENYTDVAKDELITAMGGSFPVKETDFLRLVKSNQICIRDMMDLLKEDYSIIMSDRYIVGIVLELLRESSVTYKVYGMLREIFTRAMKLGLTYKDVYDRIYKLSFDILGRDIYKKEIKIVDGQSRSACFVILPARIIDYTDTDAFDSVSELNSVEISIYEDDVYQYLKSFLFKYFDNTLEANKHIKSFEWNLTNNYYTFDSLRAIIRDINDTREALTTGRTNEYTDELKIKRGFETMSIISATNMSVEKVEEYNRNRPTVDDTPAEMIADFYERLIYRLEYILKVGEENGYNLISVMGP